MMADAYPHATIENSYQIKFGINMFYMIRNEFSDKILLN